MTAFGPTTARAAKLETGKVAFGMSQPTDLTATNLIEQLMQFGLAQGSLRVRKYDLRPEHSIETLRLGEKGVEAAHDFGGKRLSVGLLQQTVTCAFDGHQLRRRRN